MNCVVLSNEKCSVSGRKERINTETTEAQSSQRRNTKGLNASGQGVEKCREMAARIPKRHQNEYSVCKCSQEATMASCGASRTSLRPRRVDRGLSWRRKRSGSTLR